MKMQKTMTKKVAKKMGRPLMDSDSINEHLDGGALAFLKILKRRLMEAKSGHTDDMYHSREWSRTDDSAFFPCCGRTASSSFSRLWMLLMFMWELSCACFRHSAGFHARVILDGAACRLGKPGEVDYVLGVLGVDRVVPIVLRVPVSR